MPRPVPRHLTVERLEARAVPAAPYESLPVLPIADAAILDSARVIAARGAALGKRTDVFLKIGDSNTLDPAYLAPLGAGSYNPVASGLTATRPDLVDTLLTFRAPVDAPNVNSFTRPGRVRFGGYLPELLPNLDLEIGTSNPGIALIMVGTNDWSIYHDPEMFRGYLNMLVDDLTVAGTLPVLSTIPPNHFPQGPVMVELFNQVIAEEAAANRVPLWNAWRAFAALPGEGLLGDHLHLTHSPRGGGSFLPDDFLYAQNVRNLQALEILDWYREQVLTPPKEIAPLATWTPLPAAEPVFAVGRDAVQRPTVDVFSARDGRLLDRFAAYESSFLGGVRVATGDVNGDGTTDLVTAPGPGGGPLVKVFSGFDGSPLGAFFAFEPTFIGGLSVAARDLDGDAKAEIIVGAGAGGGPVVAVYRGGDLAPLHRFFAFEPTFLGGVDVAAANIAGTGPVVAVGAGVGGGPAVKIFRADTLDVTQAFFAYAPTVRDGVTVAAADLDGDGFDELVTAPAVGAPHIRVFEPATLTERVSYFAGDPRSLVGVRIAALPAVPGEQGILLFASGPGERASLRLYSGLSDQFTLLPSTEPNRAYGLFVG